MFLQFVFKLLTPWSKSPICKARRGCGAGEAASRIAHVFRIGCPALDFLPVTVRHEPAVWPSFAWFGGLSGVGKAASPVPDRKLG